MSSVRLAVDFGTTNTVVAVVESGNVRILDLPGLCRQQPIEQAPLIPTAVHISEIMRRRWLFFSQRVQDVRIGQQALNQNYGNAAEQSGAFVHSFKPLLGAQSHRSVARVGSVQLSAREATALFLRQLLAAVRQQGIRPTDVTIPAPVGYYEPFRAELQSIAKDIGITNFHTLDEPVAAAVGYGVNVAREETLLVVDFGGGTLNLAAVRLGPEAAQGRASAVLAKHMVPLGGSDVDQWLLEHLVMDMSGLPGWEYDALWEVMRVKEAVSRGGSAEFRWNGIRRPVTHDDLVRLLTERGLYREIQAGLTEIRRQLDESETGVDEVLLVGGSTLLPGVPAEVDRFFPKAIVRHDPAVVFTAVATGAARFAGGLPVDDHIYHDYALAVRDERTHRVQYERIIPRQTRYPTSSDFAVRHYADYLDMKEMSFEVYEVGRLGQKPVAWQPGPNGNAYWTPHGADESACLVRLNAADAPLPLRPAGKGTSPRLRVTYSVNSSRWLCQTVEDLVRRETLRSGEPVVRLR